MARRRPRRLFGRVDVLVANAGVLLQEHVLEMDMATWQRTLDVNLTGVFESEP
jgi:3-oxoacyl-[acyl-carrier protein] reductase